MKSTASGGRRGCSLSFATILLGDLGQVKVAARLSILICPRGRYWLPPGGLVGKVPWVHVLWWVPVQRQQPASLK